MSSIAFTSVERVLAKFHRELKGTLLNESDIIEWIGEALDFMKMPEIQDQSVAFLKVENFEAALPKGFQMVIQIMKYEKQFVEHCEKICPEKEEELKIEGPTCLSKTDMVDYMLGTLDMSYRPLFDMQWQYIDWKSYTDTTQKFSPVRLANSTLFNSLVCKDSGFDYKSCVDEYNIVGTAERKLRFSFKDGYVAMPYIRSALDPDTGYPLIPDTMDHISAINYYVRWKIAEFKDWNGREGFKSISELNMTLWFRYSKKAMNSAKMPKTIDEHQDLLEMSMSLVPQPNKYYGYFGNLGRK